MTDKELIARLRWKAGAYAKEAADRIELLATTCEQLVATNEVLRGALAEIESISVHSGGEIHGITATHWKMAFEQAQDVARAALKGN